MSKNKTKERILEIWLVILLFMLYSRKDNSNFNLPYLQLLEKRRCFSPEGTHFAFLEDNLLYDEFYQMIQEEDLPWEEYLRELSLG